MAEDELSEDQLEFLTQCESDFINRYTDKDKDFTIVFEIGVSRPPIIEPWRASDGFRHSRNHYRDNDRKRKRMDNNVPPFKK